MLKSFHHVGIVVEDMARSLAFYQSVLGGIIALDLAMDLREFGEGVGIPGAKARVIFLQIPGLSPQIELLQYSSGAGKRVARDSSSTRPGNTHAAFLVTDIARVYNDFNQKGAHFISKPSAFPAGHPLLGGVKFCYFQDPDGALLELVEFPR
jgi:glyoxylase I family protein